MGRFPIGPARASRNHTQITSFGQSGTKSAAHIFYPLFIGDTADAATRLVPRCSVQEVEAVHGEFVSAIVHREIVYLTEFAPKSAVHHPISKDNGFTAPHLS